MSRRLNELERESGKLESQVPAQRSQWQDRPAFQLVETHGHEEDGSEELTRGLWAPLNPKLMPPPPRDRTSLPGLGLIAGLLCAVGAAAAVALVVANMVRIPSLDSAVFATDEAARRRPVSAAVPERLSATETAQVTVQPAVASQPVVASSPPAAPLAPPGPVLASTQMDAVPAGKPLVVALPPSLPPPPQAAPAQADARTLSTTTAPVPEPRPAVSLSRGEIASLVKRGQDLIAAGDIASGRLVLTRPADAGDADACFILASTFDPAVLANLRVVGVKPDPAKARAWYTQTNDGGLVAKIR